MVLKRIGPMSCAKIYGVLCVAIGLFVGIIFAVVTWMTSQLFGPGMESGDVGGGFGFIFGAGAIIALPILYGIVGFILGYLSAVIYNWIANFIGGIELEFE